VVTHHAPTRHAILPRYDNSPLNKCFYSFEVDMFLETRLIAPKFWFFGHTHSNLHQRIGNTTIVAHQRGYPGESGHRDYEPLVIDV
jgi:hypothetical protein